MLTHAARVAWDARMWRPMHARLLAGEAAGVMARDRGARLGFSDEQHLAAAAGWLARAQDVMRDGGIAARFHLATGWSPSCAETTGYLIPTFLQLAREPGQHAFEERAERAVAFLLLHQLRNGAFGDDEAPANTSPPSVFTSAQVLAGLVAWHRRTREQRALDAAVRTADWLLSVQDSDGAWRRHVLLGFGAAYYAYASCWLAELGVYLGEQRYMDAARQHLTWVLSHTDRQTGWIDRAGVDAKQHLDRTAFTHSIAYTLRGTLMTSELLGVREGIRAAERASLEVVRRLELLQWLPAILDSRWEGRAEYSCVVGDAQMAVVWLRLFERDRSLRLAGAAMSIIDGVKRSQLMDVATPDLHGAIAGSDPVWGGYQRLAYPTWAAKFFVDALLAKRRILQAHNLRIHTTITRGLPDQALHSVERSSGVAPVAELATPLLAAGRSAEPASANVATERPPVRVRTIDEATVPMSAFRPQSD